MSSSTAEFIKIPQSASHDGIAEYSTGADDISPQVKKRGKSCCSCDSWCSNSKHPDGFYFSPCCYRHNCVMMNGVFLCFSVIICIGVLMGLALTSGKPHIKTLFFVKGQCTTVRANLTGTEEDCNCGGRFCHATFPCLEIIVRYVDAAGHEVETILHENEHVYTYRPLCSYEPDKCIQSQNNWYVDYYWSKWGQPGFSYPCHHHPDGGAAVRHRTKSDMFTIHMLLWPSVSIFISTLLACIVYCHCCPRCYNE